MISTKKTSQPSVSKRIFSASIVKPFVAASTILLIDRMYFKNTNMRSNIYFAGSVFAMYVHGVITEMTVSHRF